MRRSTVQVAAIWCVAIWPAVNFTAHNFADVLDDGPGSLAGVALITLAFGAVGHVLHYGLSKRNLAGLPVVIFAAGICLLFSYSLIRDSSMPLLARLHLGLPASAGWLLLAAIVFGVVIRFRQNEGLQIAASIFCFLVIAQALGKLALAAATTSKDRSESSNADITSGQASVSPSGAMNVYFIVLDGYSGRDGLQEFSEFDDADFLRAMSDRGFVDAATRDAVSVRSNYLITQLSLGSIFALDYTRTDDPQTWTMDRRTYPNIVNGARTPPLIDGFQSAGYVTWETFNVVNGCSGRHMRCLGGSGSLNLDYMTMAFVAPTPLGRAITLFLTRRVDGLASITANLQKVEDSGRPSFVFVHSLVTHPPFLSGVDCGPSSQGSVVYKDWNPGARPAYIDAIRCANARLIELADRISARNPDAVIVIQGDHGSGFTVDWRKPITEWSASAIRERSSFLNLIKAPRSCAQWLDRPIAQVNSARFALACARRQPPQFSPEHTYLSSYPSGDEGREVLLMDAQGARGN